jgi:hypothetical protein
VFRRLAEAEARVHGIAMEKVHFHEVGALDAIADIVGAVAGLDLLGVTAVYASPITLGQGQVECRHGTLPVPAPAVAYLVEGFEVRFTDVQRELTTPTGAAIVTTLATRGARPSSFIMERVGYGFGREEEGSLPNALRIMVGSLPAAAEEIVLLETNLDDVTGESVGFLIERCLELGALDAYAAPVQMKKSRPGLVFSALCTADRMIAVRDLIHGESGTLGLRIQRVERFVLPREIVTRDTSLGKVRVKRARLPDGTVALKPEHDDAARIAREKNLPLRTVLETLRNEL